jgi:hypothetical protein
MGTMLGFIALVAISSHLAPYLTRREMFFGVTGGVVGQLGPFPIIQSSRLGVRA